MPHFICTTCGTQYAEAEQPPDRCAICEDERQYVGWDGQQWTTLDELRADHTEPDPGRGAGPDRHRHDAARSASASGPCWSGRPAATSCGTASRCSTTPRSRRSAGLGGLAAIAISHPHYYSSMVEWSRAFGGVPIYLHAADRQWVMRPDPAIVFWEGETEALHDGLTLIRCGGHFEGGTVLHWPAGADGKGALLTGDILQVVPWTAATSASCTRYPNYIPLPADAVRRAVAAVEPFAFDRIYGFMFDLAIMEDGKAAVRRSAERYLRAIGADEAGG